MVFLILCDLSSGDFLIKVMARNMAGLGKTVTVLANLDGKNTFKLENFMLVTDDAFKRHHANFWQEKIFLSDHGEIPKVMS